MKARPVSERQCGQLSVWKGEVDQRLYGVEDGGRRLSCDEDPLTVGVDAESVSISQTGRGTGVDVAEL